MPEAASVPTEVAAPFPTPRPGAFARLQPEVAKPDDDLSRRVRALADDLRPLVVTADEAQRARAKARGAPRWTDVFTTQFTEFSNRPR